MIIFSNNLKRLFKNTGVLIFMIFVPIGLIVTITGLAGNSSSGINIGLVDMIKQNSRKDYRIIFSKTATIKIMNEIDLKEKLLQQLIDVAIIIDKGSTDKIISGKEVNIKYISLQDVNMGTVAKFEVNNYLNDVLAYCKE